MMKEENNEIIVIGAGPAGLAAAVRLAELNKKTKVFEFTQKVGGMSGSMKIWGHIVDFGPHRFFSSDKVVVNFWHRYVKDNFVMVKRQTRIYFKNKFFNYPLKPFNALKNLGVKNSFFALISYFKSKILPLEEDGSMEIWLSNRFGYKLFKTFFKTYTEKLWGKSCLELDADWAAQRIQKLTLGGALKNALKLNFKNKHKTLVDEFAYPNIGNQFFYEELKNFVEDFNKQEIMFNSKVSKILIDKNQVIGIELSNGKEYNCKWLISSMPITSLVSSMEDVPREVISASKKLRFRNTILVYLLIESNDIFPDQWLYIHDPSVLHGRITNFRNWSPDIVNENGTTVICMEFWCFDDDDIWNMPEEDLINLASKEITQIGLVQKEQILEGKLVRIPKCYPMYERGYKENLNVVIQFLNKINGLIPIGRYGSFKYNNQDHSLLMGIMAAESIAINKPPNLWEINTDSKYQEAGNSSDISNT